MCVYGGRVCVYTVVCVCVCGRVCEYGMCVCGDMVMYIIVLPRLVTNSH